MKKLLCVGILLLPFASYADGAKDSVIDLNENRVVDARGDCVRTKWDGNIGCEDAVVSKDEAQVSVYFDFNSASLRADSRNDLNSLLSSVSISDETEANIAGFADRIGGSSYNNELSRKRALTVENYLAGKGVSRVNTSVTAKGENYPVTNCGDNMEKSALISCLQEDRRVDISISK